MRQFIRAERCGDWELHLLCVKKMLPLLHATGHLHYARSAHLYVQLMENLSSSMPKHEFDKFTAAGYFTIRRGHSFWSGTWSDMIIEQELMRTLKVKGGVTQGRGMTESVLSQWILSAPGCLKLCDALESLCGISSTSSGSALNDKRVKRIASWM